MQFAPYTRMPLAPAAPGQFAPPVDPRTAVINAFVNRQPGTASALVQPQLPNPMIAHRSYV